MFDTGWSPAGQIRLPFTFRSCSHANDISQDLLPVTTVRILLIEDYALLRTAVEARLRQEGYAVDATGEGDEGLWLATENPYSLVILDLTLPKLDGLEVLKAVRRIGRNTGVIITTARDTVADRIRGLDSGADDYLVKPFSLDELMARIRVQLRRINGRRDPTRPFGTAVLPSHAAVSRRVALADHPWATASSASNGVPTSK